MRAILAHADVGQVHSSTPRPIPPPAITRFNPIYRFSYTAAACTAPPEEPLVAPAVPDRHLPPMSHAYNRSLGNGTPRVQCNNIIGGVGSTGGWYVI